MTTARCILADKTYFTTRRCSDRRFFLKPDPVVTAVFLYCLAVAAERHGVQIHAVCMMSNHYHLVLTDVRGELPLFMAWLNRHSAICLKIHRKRAGDLWDASEKYSAVELVSPEAVWKYIVYTLANPTKAGLVRHGRDWPGLLLGPEAWLREPVEAPHPGLFFKTSDKPAPVLRLVAPPTLMDREPQALVAELSIALEERESAIAAELAREGRRFLGRRAVLRQRPYDRPSKNNPPGTRNPVFAAVTAEARRAAVKALRSFRAWYRHAYQCFCHGERHTEFPPGTWGMARLFGAQVASR
ncbi:MAG: transposase [Deltaproteobacteria bacterium]|nr:transposase [Deltaproteobacteria bacterium]